MTLLLYVLVLAAAAAFIAASLARAVRYARAPIHLRWEIYPVPEGPGGQLRVMIPEILFLKGLWEFNRRLWLRSYPFHLGLYMTIAAVAILAVAAFVPSALLEACFAVLAPAGAILIIAGASALLRGRLADPALKPYTTGGDLFNLVAFIVAFGVLLAGYNVDAAVTFARGLAAFDTSLPFAGTFAAGVVLASLLAAYIPLTHMSHYVAKYFTYHAVRWDDHAPGGSIGKRVAEYLAYRPTWSAPHVGANGARTWADVATTNPAKGAAK